MQYKIPGMGELEINTIILDLNGTLSVGGKIVDGVHDRIENIKRLGIKFMLFTGNTRNDADEIAHDLDIDWKQASNAIEKRNLARSMNPDTCASIGNGRIDLELMEVVKLGIAVLQAEGVHTRTLLACDLVVPTINDALDLFIDQDRLIASLRS